MFISVDSLGSKKFQISVGNTKCKIFILNIIIHLGKIQKSSFLTVGSILPALDEFLVIQVSEMTLVLAALIWFGYKK